ncbi:uncharacterized protein LOC122921665 [Bufo gargarizans]|uniref:uncharacterized protein LOC122921665 n=1 Tax=Bufo gargarizans TaxID=30331 RepID=UPI001CF19C84|nr:uncharacterized protein LOC122921665 [Bufo gargarizans]
MKEKLTLPSAAPSYPPASIFLLPEFTAKRDMDSMVTVFELQKDCSVKQHAVPLTFPRVNKSRLYVVTNQNTQLHLLNNPVGSPRPEEGGDAFQGKTIFQHGMSTKVLAIMDATGTAWEVRVLLSPLEISRLSSNFNLTGFVRACLTMEEYQKSLSSLCGVQKLCMAASQFLSFTEDSIVNDYCKELDRLLTEKVGASCIGQQEMNSMVFGALVALVAAELAASGGTRSFDYRPKKKNTQEDQREQIQEMVKVFDVMVDLLSVSHQRKRLQILFRNPCPDNWASGGKTLAHSGETFVFGLSHKVVSISEAESEIQFLQNLQESYDLISVFHLPALVEHLLMTSTWRNKIELFLKEKNLREEIIYELSTLAERFICSKICKQIFLKEFQKEMFKKWLSAQVFLEGDEVVCCFGILVAILAAVIAKSIADRPSTDSEEEEGPEEPTAELVVVDDNRSSASTSLDDSISSFEVILTTVSDEYGGAQPNLYCTPGELVKVEDKSGEEGIGGVESKIDRNNDSGTTYQGNIDGCLKTTESLAELPDVSLIDIADQKADCDTADENVDVYPDSKDDSNEDGNCIGDCSVAEPPSQGTPENALETQVPSENRVFYTSFLGLMFLLVVTMLSNVLPHSVGSILVAIILGLLIVKWLTSQQP